jgi:hypothetical protein
MIWRNAARAMAVAGLATIVTIARAADTPEVAFEKFCGEWMQKLAVRERDNLKQIRWVPNSSGVEGEYTGYSSDHVCMVKPNGDKKAVPIGKIIYHEIRYKKAGATPDTAIQASPHALEAIEVTEIFRYGKGKWQY